jgi:TonB family protein
MRGYAVRSSIAVGVIAFGLGLSHPALARQTASAQRQQTAAPGAGRTIRAADGDTILLDSDANILVVRRQNAFVRTVFNPTDRWLILIADFPPRDSKTPDGVVDAILTYRNVAGDWPVPERWDGEAVIETYTPSGPDGSAGPQSIGVRLPAGLVQFIGGPADRLRNPSAIAHMSHQGMGRTNMKMTSFEDAEQQALANMARNNAIQVSHPGAQVQSYQNGSGFSVSSSTQLTATPAAVPGAVPAPPAGFLPPQAAVRVGSMIANPRKTFDVPAVAPQQARDAGITGVVILELTVDADGAVSNVRVLRSIPLLDAAAVAAAKQWRYEPVMLNGRPVPVILTAPVQFQ